MFRHNWLKKNSALNGEKVQKNMLNMWLRQELETQQFSLCLAKLVGAYLGCHTIFPLLAKITSDKRAAQECQVEGSQEPTVTHTEEIWFVVS